MSARSCVRTLKLKSSLFFYLSPPHPPPPALRYSLAVLSLSTAQHQSSSSSARSTTTKRCVAPSARYVARKTRADGSRVGSPRGAPPLDDADLWTRSLDRNTYAPRPEPRAAAARASPSLSHPAARPPPPRRLGKWRCCLCHGLSISRVREVRAQRKQSYRTGEVPPPRFTFAHDSTPSRR